MTSFDVHQHLWPEQLVAALRARSRPPRIEGEELILGEGTFEAELEAHSLEARLALLDAVGIDVHVDVWPECQRHAPVSHCQFRIEFSGALETRRRARRLPEDIRILSDSRSSDPRTA